ncbi:hypothetical protein [Galactobacter sp.]|uniref:hypothetical protein n=1 Tax=Galactobacter sp. TaxID=2676125 RepID=UPI0025C32F65|nr:hypothetical protein [Galactobacter sp.]
MVHSFGSGRSVVGAHKIPGSGVDFTPRVPKQEHMVAAKVLLPELVARCPA